MSNRFNRQINIEKRPVQMVGSGTLNDRNLLDTRIPKPWKLFERQE